MSSGFEELLTGRTLVKRYTIREVIGRGGFAVVYCADDLRLGRPTAVKVLSIPAPTPELREHMRARFEREARAAAALPHHPNVVPVYDFGTDPDTGIDFIVMELLRGENVAAYLAREGRPPLPLALRILRDGAEGIAVGHRAGLIHRDIKPANLFLAEAQGDQPFRVCVLDFGIARLTADDDDGSMTRTRGAAPLSPAYASPEQLRGDLTLTPATDVYALGVVGYQLLTGKKPFGADRDSGSPSSLQPIRELNPQVSPELAAVIERAMLPEPGARFTDAGEFAAALDAAENEEDSGTLIATSLPPIMDDDDERTVIAPTPVVVPVAAAVPVQHAPPPAAPPPPLRENPTPPPPRRKRPAWMLVLPILLLGLVAGLWAMNRGGGDVDRSPGVPADSVRTSGGEPEDDPADEPLPVDPGPTQPVEDPGGGEPVQVPAEPSNPDDGGNAPVITQPAPQPSAPAPQPGQVVPRPAPAQPVQRQPVQRPRPNLPPQRQAPRRPVPQQPRPQPQQPQPQPPQPQPVPQQPQPQPQPPAPQPVPQQPQPQPQPPAPTPTPPRDTIVLPPAPPPPPPSPPSGGTAGGSGTPPSPSR
ncbi:MAG TPA: serine/threonine-protein kinase [Longimicrobium sp.]|jgi:serine/threonine-protein kinase